MELFCDNKVAVDMPYNPVQHDMTKYVEIDRYFIKEKIETKVITIPHIRSNEQVADILTKGVAVTIFHDMLTKFGMFDLYIPT
jgi:hypothetical protein